VTRLRLSRLESEGRVTVKWWESAWGGRCLGPWSRFVGVHVDGIATSSTAGSFFLATGRTDRKTPAGYRGSRPLAWDGEGRQPRTWRAQLWKARRSKVRLVVSS